MATWPLPTNSPCLPVAGSEHPASGKEILLVDRAGSSHQQLRTDLEQAGFLVQSATTAGEALDRLRQSEVDLILLGDSLPGITGLDLLRLLRAAWSPQQLPVILIGENLPRERQMAALEAGANDCLGGPPDSLLALARVQSQVRQKEAGQGVRDRAERIFRATSGVTDVVWEWNVTTDSVWFSPEWSRICGRLAANPSNLGEWLAAIHPDDASPLEMALRHVRDDLQQFEFSQEYRLLTASGDLRWIYCRANVERDRHGQLLRITGLQTDITRSKSVDWLTQLPNRENILARVERMLAAQNEQPKLGFALLFVDVDRFRVVNESLGHAVGDSLLREIAIRLERCTRTLTTQGRSDDYLARLHGDKFVLLISESTRPEVCRAIADRVQMQLRRPFQLVGRELRLSASIGIAISNRDRYLRGSEMLRDAEIALQQAKTLGRSRAVIFDSKMRRDAVQKMDLELDLRHAMERDELLLHYQPKIDLRTGDLAGFEALMRWQHPRLGLVPPLQFIPIAEESGIIVPIGAWALRTGANQLAKWLELKSQPQLQLSVNLSVKQFFVRELVNQVGALVRSLRLPIDLLSLEVTESILIGEIQQALEILTNLRRVGASLMIDDFGTGYSSLHYLSNLPFQTLKIDRSFVARMLEDENCAEVVKAVVTLAGNLKMDVIAEGVETAVQAQELQRIGCRYAQGFYFSKAVDDATATRMVADRQKFF